jgi:hypothetical protein
MCNAKRGQPSGSEAVGLCGALLFTAEVGYTTRARGARRWPPAAASRWAIRRVLCEHAEPFESHPCAMQMAHSSSLAKKKLPCGSFSF